MSLNPEAKIVRLQQENEELRKEIFELKRSTVNGAAINSETTVSELRSNVLDLSEYVSIFEQVSLGLMVYDDNLNILETNAQFGVIFELSRSQLIGMDLKELRDKRVLPALKVVFGGKSGYYEGQYISTFTDSVKYLVLNSKPHQIFLNGKTISGGLVVVEDITEKKIAEEAVSKSFDIFQTVTDNINAQIYAIEPRTHKILFMNRKARTFFGTKFGNVCEEFGEVPEIEHLDCLQCILPEDKLQTLAPDEIYQKEAFNKYAGKWYQYSYSLIGWINGGRALLVTAIDVHKQRVAIEQVQAQNEKINRQAETLQADSDMKDTLFSIIGHDLRGPIGNIKSALDILIEEYPTLEKDDIREFINTVRDSAGSAYSLLANLLNWAKNRTGRINYMSEPINISEVIDENITLFGANFDNKKIEITVDEGCKGNICGDENMINTVVRNLISNAVKFTPNQGYVVIHTEEVERNAKKYLQIEVCDTGIGIPEEKISEIFNSVKPRSTYGTNNEKGSGLGLILCRAFVEKHNGLIEIESSVGTGTCVKVLLPEICEK